jgi:hypothetical protein
MTLPIKKEIAGEHFEATRSRAQVPCHGNHVSCLS